MPWDDAGQSKTVLAQPLTVICHLLVTREGYERNEVFRPVFSFREFSSSSASDHVDFRKWQRQAFKDKICFDKDFHKGLLLLARRQMRLA
jgi:hypothetical protein